VANDKRTLTKRTLPAIFFDDTTLSRFGVLLRGPERDAGKGALVRTRTWRPVRLMEGDGTSRCKALRSVAAVDDVLLLANLLVESRAGTEMTSPKNFA
jgi:hypothetical protein